MQLSIRLFYAEETRLRPDPAGSFTPGANDSLYHLSEYAAAHLPAPPAPRSLLTSFTQSIYSSIHSADGSEPKKLPRCQSTLSLECLHVSRAPGGIDFASMTCRVNRLISPAVFIQRCPLLRGLHMRSQMAFAVDQRRRVRRAPPSAFLPPNGDSASRAPGVTRV